MKLSCNVEINDEVMKISDHKVYHMALFDPVKANQIVESAIIPEMNYISGILNNILNEFNADPNEPIIIAAPNRNEMTYILGLYLSLYTGNSIIEGPKENEEFIYVGKIKDRF
jgi:hypothetical protein